MTFILTRKLIEPGISKVYDRSPKAERPMASDQLCNEPVKCNELSNEITDNESIHSAYKDSISNRDADTEIFPIVNFEEFLKVGIFSFFKHQSFFVKAFVLSTHVPKVLNNLLLESNLPIFNELTNELNERQKCHFNPLKSDSTVRGTKLLLFLLIIISNKEALVIIFISLNQSNKATNLPESAAKIVLKEVMIQNHAIKIIFRENKVTNFRQKKFFQHVIIFTSNSFSAQALDRQLIQSLKHEANKAQLDHIRKTICPRGICDSHNLSWIFFRRTLNRKVSRTKMHLDKLLFKLPTILATRKSASLFLPCFLLHQNLRLAHIQTSGRKVRSERKKNSSKGQQNNSNISFLKLFTKIESPYTFRKMNNGNSSPISTSSAGSSNAKRMLQSPESSSSPAKRPLNEEEEFITDQLSSFSVQTPAHPRVYDDTPLSDEDDNFLGDGQALLNPTEEQLKLALRANEATGAVNERLVQEIQSLRQQLKGQGPQGNLEALNSQRLNLSSSTDVNASYEDSSERASNRMTGAIPKIVRSRNFPYDTSYRPIQLNHGNYGSGGSRDLTRSNSREGNTPNAMVPTALPQFDWNMASPPRDQETAEQEINQPDPQPQVARLSSIRNGPNGYPLEVVLCPDNYPDEVLDQEVAVKVGNKIRAFVEGENRALRRIGEATFHPDMFGMLFISCPSQMHTRMLCSLVESITWRRFGIPRIVCMDANEAPQTNVLDAFCPVKEHSWVDFLNNVTGIALGSIQFNTTSWRPLKVINSRGLGKTFVFLTTDRNFTNEVAERGTLQVRYPCSHVPAKFRIPDRYKTALGKICDHSKCFPTFNAIFFKDLTEPLVQLTRLLRLIESSKKPCAKWKNKQLTSPTPHENRHKFLVGRKPSLILYLHLIIALRNLNLFLKFPNMNCLLAKSKQTAKAQILKRKKSPFQTSKSTSKSPYNIALSLNKIFPEKSTRNYLLTQNEFKRELRRKIEGHDPLSFLNYVVNKRNKICNRTIILTSPFKKLDVHSLLLRESGKTSFDNG